MFSTPLEMCDLAVWFFLWEWVRIRWDLSEFQERFLTVESVMKNTIFCRTEKYVRNNKEIGRY